MVPQIVGPNTPDFCSDVVNVPVPLAGAAGSYRLGKMVLKTEATVYDGRGDRDLVQLVCTPP